jgi:hypothetical protein
LRSANAAISKEKAHEEKDKARNKGEGATQTAWFFCKAKILKGPLRQSTAGNDSKRFKEEASRGSVFWGQHQSRRSSKSNQCLVRLGDQGTGQLNFAKEFKFFFDGLYTIFAT